MLVVIKGAGDLASGIALRLFHAGFSIIMTETPEPTSIRRTVCFSEAVRNGKTTVEDATALFAKNAEAAIDIIRGGNIAVLVDPAADCVNQLQPDIVVDAIIAKRNTGTRIDDAPTVIGVGPGFTAGVDCHAAVETMRGHYLGRAIYKGSPAPNTNIPGLIGGFAGERVLRAPDDGVFKQYLKIGDAVKAGDIAGTVNRKPMICHIDGVLRGIIAEGTRVRAGMKCGDVDPRGDGDYCYRVSDKALSVAGGVLEAILRFSHNKRGVRFAPEHAGF